MVFLWFFYVYQAGYSHQTSLGVGPDVSGATSGMLWGTLPAARRSGMPGEFDWLVMTYGNSRFSSG